MSLLNISSVINHAVEVCHCKICCCEEWYFRLSAGTPPLGSSTGMATFSNLPNRNLAFTLRLNVQPRCGQTASQVTRQFRRGMNATEYTPYCLTEWFTGM